MTCKDCLHSHLCRQNGTMMYYQHKGKQLMEDAEKACPWNMFKNKADYAEVNHGEWIDRCVRAWHCSLCDCDIQKVRKVDGYCYDDMPKYCPKCGAKMDGNNLSTIPTGSEGSSDNEQSI